MTDQLATFTFDGDNPVRVIDLDGQPWFVATDIADVLEYRDATALIRGLKGRSVRTHKVCTNKGSRNATIISEPGLYLTLMRAKTKRAEPFQEWVTREVLPTIRQTGNYTTHTNELLADREERITTLEKALTARDDQITMLTVTLTNQEKTVHTFVTDDADYTIRQTAKLLQRDLNCTTSERELYARLDEWGWIYRDKKTWQPYASAVKTGRLRLKIGTSTNPDGARIGRYPQLRVTPKGLLDIHGRLIGAETFETLYGQTTLFEEPTA